MDLPFLAIIFFCLVAASAIFSINFDTPWQHFSDQSQSYLKGRLDVTPLSFDQHDYTFVNNKYYWPQGPFPSVLLMPFQFIFGPSFEQALMQTILIISLILMIYTLALIKKFSIIAALYLTAAFFIGSPVIGIILDPKSWFYAQVVTVTLLTALLLEFETKRRWWIIGTLEACILASRPTAGIIILFLIPFLVFQKTHSHKKFVNLISLLLPVAISGVLLLWFNFARFGNFFDNGYYTNDVGGFIGPLRDIGVFSIQHIPGNIYYYFLISVDPIKEGARLLFPYIKYNVWGLSFFLVAPFFLYSLKALSSKDNIIRGLLMVSGLTLLIELMYYAPGWYQFGPRYISDFMPILFLLTLYSLEDYNLTYTQKFIITLSCLFNIYLLITPLLFKIPS